LEAAVQADLEKRYNTLLDSAKTHLEAGRYTDAIRDAQTAQQIFPANAEKAGAAVDVRRQAEQALTMLVDQEQRKQAYAKAMEQGSANLRDRRFPEAGDNFKLAL